MCIRIEKPYHDILHHEKEGICRSDIVKSARCLSIEQNKTYSKKTRIMSRLEAVTQYENALKQGKKYYNACVSRNEFPYPVVLDELVNMSSVGSVDLGLVEVPIDRIIGTWTGGRKAAFAGNFMPLMEEKTEFGDKWINLCVAHLDQGGITDPIICYEYLGDFYVKEGHKRVSVLKSYGAYEITGNVTRLIPQKSDDPKIRIYYEFMDFYKLSKLYMVDFTQSGSYAKLQAALGFAPDQEWKEETRHAFRSVFNRFSECYTRLNTENLPLTAGDAFLAYLKVHPYSEVQEQSESEIRDHLTKLWPDIRLIARGEPISVTTEPEEKGKSLLSRILGSPKLHAAFIYNFDPKTSPWASAHEQGQKYLEEKLGDSIEISSYLCADDPDTTMETAVNEGANVLFATTPTLISSCRKIAAKYKNIAVYNCSLSMPYAGVRSYYFRIYEGKFIAGAIAGAMANEDHIGYSARYPIMGSIAAINAFALGARLTNPRARISLKWTCLPGYPLLEFKNEGISVISNRDADGSDESLTWLAGTYAIKPDGEMQSLAAPRWDWGIYYEKTIRSLMNSSIDAVRDSNNAINDWWGMSTGAVHVELDKDLPDGMKMLAKYLSDGIISGAIDPFLCPIRDQNGEVISDGTRVFSSEELMRMDKLCENVDGTIPAFEELLPQSRNLVRLLGIYRETIPPEAQEQAL